VDIVAQTIAVTAFTGEIGDGERADAASSSTTCLASCHLPSISSWAAPVNLPPCAGKMFIHPVADVVRV